MAGFQTHITVSTISGAAYGAAAWYYFDVPPAACVLSAGLCGVSGMLPDLDSGSGIPLRESVAFAAAVVPMMLVDRLRALGLPSEAIVLAGAAIYLVVRFGFGAFLRKYTVHRGMFHSLPAAVIFAQLAFLLASGDLDIRLYKAGAVLLGFLSHLVLDEIWSVQWTGWRFRMKSSSGTALKFWGRSLWGNVSVYAKLLILTFLVLNDSTWIESSNDPIEHSHQIAHSVLEHIIRR